MNDLNNESCDCGTPPPVTTPKSRFAGISLKDVLVVSKKDNKERLLSDIEYLSNEQYEFLEKHTQQKFYGFMQTYWSKKMLSAGLTTKTHNGEVLNFDWSQIRVIDKRYKGASHCICGKAIRYEYWLSTYGPIGSVHIGEHAGLNAELVRDITKGYKEQNELRTEIVHLLADLKKTGKTYDDWKTEFNLDMKMPALSLVHPMDQQTLMDLNTHKLPYSKHYRDALNLAYRRYVYQQQTPVVTPVVASVVAPSEQTPLITYSTKEAVNDEIKTRVNLLIDRVFDPVTKSLKSKEVAASQGYNVNTLISIARAINKNKATFSQAKYATALCEMIEEVLTLVENTTVDVQQLARQCLTYLINNHADNDFARDLYDQSLTRELTANQLQAIFGIKRNSTKNTSLYERYSLQNAGIVNPLK